MICDADVHYCPKHLFDNLKDRYPDFVENYNDLCYGMNLDAHWKSYYNDVKDSSWPTCDTRHDFKDLSLPIRTEIHDSLKDINNRLFQVDPTYTKILIDHYNNYAPDLQGHLSGIKLTKTSRQLLNMHAPFTSMYYQTDKKLAVDLMHTWNDKMYQTINDYPDKFDATAWLALQDLDASLLELQKIIDRGFYAVQMHSHVLWAFVPQLWKIFEICEKNNLPIYFHNTKHTHSPLPWQLNKNENYNHLKSIWPYPTNIWFINIAGIITEGVLEKYPNLKIIMAEFDIDWITPMREKMIGSKFLDPLPYFQKNFFFTVETENPNFLTSANLIGWDRLLFATDYPHNDPGGRHRFDDVDLLNCFLREDKITQTQYDLLTHRNYLSLAR